MVSILPSIRVGDIMKLENFNIAYPFIFYINRENKKDVRNKFLYYHTFFYGNSFFVCELYNFF